MEPRASVALRIPDVDPATANRLIEELESDLLRLAAPDLQLARERETAEAMDFGATLVLVLGAPAVVTAAKALIRWAARTNTARLELTHPNGSRVVLEHVESKNLAEVAAALAPLVAAQGGQGEKP